MRLGELSAEALRASLERGLVIATGPIKFRIQSSMPQVLRGIERLYVDFELPEGDFFDYDVRVDHVPGLRSHWRPQVSFQFDAVEPFKPLPADHAFALLEWGLNWCIAGHAHHYLLLHAAVLERNGHAIVLPGDPGAGKSTLTAALALSGYRLLSDEMALIDRDTGLLVPLARPVNLKNESIAIVKRFDPTAVFGDPAADTHKGTVAHLKPPTGSVLAVNQPAKPAFVVYPRWQSGSPATLTPRPKADAFMHAAHHAFNYELLGSTGFDLMAGLIDGSECYDFRYTQLSDAIAVFDRLTQ